MAEPTYNAEPETWVAFADEIGLDLGDIDGVHRDRIRRAIHLSTEYATYVEYLDDDPVADTPDPDDDD